MKLAVVVALLAAFVYMFVTPQDGQPPFHYTSKLSKDGRVPFFSRSIEAGPKRIHISVYVKNPTGDYFALCVVRPGETLPPYRLKSACGGQAASRMTTSDHDVVQRSRIFDDREITLDWYSNGSRSQSGNFSVVYENHNAISAAKFEAFVATDTYYDLALLDTALSYPLLAVRRMFKAASSAYSAIRPASCRASAQSDFTRAAVVKCNSFLSSNNLRSLLVVCSSLSAGHLALVLIILLNLLCFLPSISDQGWWALSSSSPRLKSFFTYQFAHANMQHIAGNMLTLLFVGSEVSESLNCDHVLFLVFYLLCGLAGGVFAVWFSPNNVRTVGASGSVSGVIVALSVLRPNAAVTILGDVNASNPIMLLVGTLLADLQRLGVSWQVPHPLFLTAPVMLLMHVLFAWQGHLGGGIAGYLLAHLRVALLRELAA